MVGYLNRDVETPDYICEVRLMLPDASHSSEKISPSKRYCKLSSATLDCQRPNVIGVINFFASASSGAFGSLSIIGRMPDIRQINLRH